MDQEKTLMNEGRRFEKGLACKEANCVEMVEAAPIFLGQPLSLPYLDVDDVVVRGDWFYTVPIHSTRLRVMGIFFLNKNWLL